MHEMSICEGILQILEEQAASQGYTKVRAVQIEIGALAGIEPRALAFSFDVVCRGTLAEGSRLDIVTLPASAWCMQCAGPVALDRRDRPCPRCGGHQLQVTAGDEMCLKELEVE